jgi:hypothetical protein
VCTSFNHEFRYNSKTSELPQSYQASLRKIFKLEEERKKLKVTRECNLDYMKFGFTQELGSNLYRRPFCIVFF